MVIPIQTIAVRSSCGLQCPSVFFKFKHGLVGRRKPKIVIAARYESVPIYVCTRRQNRNDCKIMRV